MCQPSNKLTLCSCAFENGFPDNYWILHRYVGQKAMMAIGGPILPFMDFESHEKVEQAILRALNSEPCFDVPVQLKNGDVLFLSFNREDQEDIYEFKSNGQK